jgi:HSP20 family protein
MFFDDVQRSLLRAQALAARSSRARGIALHVSENEQGYEVQAELPGIAKSDIDVKIKDNVVAINAKTAATTEAKDGFKVIYTERNEGQVSRRFSVASDIDEARSEASFDNGVLTLKLAKKVADNAPRQLSIA